jgi:hypothetical protein
MTKLILAALSAMLLASCATDGAVASTEPRSEAVYQTGSNIPKKQGAVAVDRETLERTQEMNVPTLRSGKGS